MTKPVLKIVRDKTSLEKLQELAKAYRDIKDVAERAKRQMELVGQELMEAMLAEQQKSVEVQDGGKVLRATYVQSERIEIDEEGLQKALGKVKYRQLCDLKLNRARLEQSVEAGDVPADLLGKYLETKPTKPFIRYTEGAAEDVDPTP